MNALMKNINLPAYVTIANDIFDAIEEGIYREKTLLPSERQLAEKYSVSKIVINRALSILEEENIIEKIPRKGSLVCERAKKEIKERPKIQISGLHPPKDINERQDKFIALLNKEFPGVDFEYAQGEYVSNEMQTFPESSDIIICSEKIFAKFAMENRLEQMVELDKEIDKSEYIPQPFFQCKIDDIPFGVPLNCNPSVLYCNNEILEKINFNGDLNNLNWEGFIKICEKIKKVVPNVFPMGYFDFSSCWWENFFYSQGVDIIHKDKLETDIFGKKGDIAIEIMKYIVQNKLAENLTIRRDALNLINEHRVGFFICNPRLICELKDSSQWRIAPIPSGTRKTSAANAFLMAVNSKSKNISLCKEILKYLLSKKFQLWLGSEHAIAPLHREALKETYKQDNLKALYAAAESAQLLPNRMEHWNIKEEIGRGIHQVIGGVKELSELEVEINNKLYHDSQEWNSIRLLGIA